MLAERCSAACVRVQFSILKLPEQWRLLNSRHRSRNVQLRSVHLPDLTCVFGLVASRCYCQTRRTVLTLGKVAARDGRSAVGFSQCDERWQRMCSGDPGSTPDPAPAPAPEVRHWLRVQGKRNPPAVCAGPSWLQRSTLKLYWSCRGRHCVLDFARGPMCAPAPVASICPLHLLCLTCAVRPSPQSAAFPCCRPRFQTLTLSGADHCRVGSEPWFNPAIAPCSGPWDSARAASHTKLSGHCRPCMRL